MHKRLTGLVLFIFDILSFITAFILSGVVSFYITHNWFGNLPVNIVDSATIKRFYYLAAMAGMALFVFYSKGYYSKRIPWWGQFRYIAITVAVMFLIEILIYFIIKHQISRLWVVFSWSFVLFFIILGRQFAKLICDKIFNIWQIPTIIIGDKENIIEVVHALYSEHYVGYQLKTLIIHKGYKDFDCKSLPLSYQNIEIIAGKETDYDNFIKENSDAFFIIAPNSFDNFKINQITTIIKAQNYNYAITPPIEGINLYNTAPQYFFGSDIMFLVSQDNINSPLGKLIKRLIDIIGSIAGIILLSPLLLIIVPIIKKDGGSVFYGSKRVGKNNQSFKCWKLRTMSVNAEKLLKDLLANNKEIEEIWKTHRKLINDPRVTKIGNFLRKTSLDEFPQLFNVLKGDMSLVGPRPLLFDPLLLDASSSFNQEELSRYISVKPGVTGLWQVSGRNDVSFKQKINCDMWYIRNWSIWHDIVIITKTVFVVIKRTGAY